MGNKQPEHGTARRVGWVIAAASALACGGLAAGAPAHASTTTTSSGTTAGVLTHPQDDHMGSSLAAGAAHQPAMTRAQAQSAAGDVPDAATTQTPGIDVSSVQGPLDWPTLENAGIKFVYAKATEGTSYLNPDYQQQSTPPAGSGILHGAYHFANPAGATGAAQADYFIANGGAWNRDGATLPGELDIESDPYNDTDGLDACYGVDNPATMLTWIHAFVNEYDAREGVYPLIYTNQGFWKQCTGNSAAFAATDPLWLADYNNDGGATMPAGWTTYTFWQYADSGTVPGDQDLFNGTYTQLQGMTSLSPNPLGLMARDSSGALWYYTENERADQALAPRTQIGTGGWQAYNTLVKVGDVTGDGKPDFIGRDTVGGLWLYAGTGDPQAPYRARVQIGHGWEIYNTIVGVGDVTGDGKPDLIGRDTSGNLWLYKGTGNAADPFGSRVQIGHGWQTYNTIVGTGDLTGDGKPDLIGRDTSGNLYLYEGTGNATTPFGNRVQIGKGWQIYNTIIGTGDLTGDGKPDLIGRDTSGNLYLYEGTGNATTPFGSRIAIGHGYQAYNLMF